MIILPLVAASQPAPQPTTTPLLEALKAEKSAQKDKETIIRAHAHYKDSAVATATKKDDKKKAAVKPAPVEQPLSKKAKKAAAKAAQQPAAPTVAQGAKGNPPSANAQQTKSPPVTPKATRAQRERQAKNLPVSTSPAPPSAGPSAQPNSDAVASAPSEAVTAPRRRPVLGLGSRQFEAALSGAGVGGGRPPRRGQGPSNPSDKDKPASDVFASVEHAGKAKAVRPPIILTRDAAGPVPKILTREGEAQEGAALDESKEGGKPGRRGRGRGRGGPRGDAAAGA